MNRVDFVIGIIRDVATMDEQQLQRFEQTVTLTEAEKKQVRYAIDIRKLALKDIDLAP